MIRSELAGFFSRLAESARLHPDVMVFMLLLLLLLFISAGLILLKLRRADSVLIAVESELDALALNLAQPSAEANLSKENSIRTGINSQIIRSNPILPRKPGRFPLPGKV